MVVLQRRELLRSAPRFILPVLLAAAVACGGEAGPTPDDAAPAGDARFTGPLENGDPMPPTGRAGGVPPYPGAVVWMRAPRPPSEFRALEAFTADSFPAVVAFYDSALGGWRRTIARDAVHYGNAGSVIVVSPWEGGDVRAGGPQPLREARTSIGIAWREGG